MKIIVTHTSPDLDAITSVWVIKRFLPGWEEAEVRFVPAGEHYKNTEPKKLDQPIEKVGDDQIIHVDTGLGPFDHHQTSSTSQCGASRSWRYVKKQSANLKHIEYEKIEDKIEAVDRIVRVVVQIDHFQEVYWPDPLADYQEFSLFGVLEGLKLQKPDQDLVYVEKGMDLLDYVLYNFENRIWAEKEIKQTGKEFTTRYGKGIGFEVINDSVIKIAQKMGYVLVVRKDPRKGYVRIKTRPVNTFEKATEAQIDLTLVYEQLSKMDPDATWFLHVSKKMLLNGTPKNPKMIPTKLSLDEIIEVLKRI